MEDAGQRLKRVRERLNLRYRDVEEASQIIADRRGNDEYVIALSRLADIENKGTVPSIFRLYTLCAIYRLDLLEVIDWYGVDAGKLAADAMAVQVSATHLIDLSPPEGAEIRFPISLDPGVDLRKTAFLSRQIQRWGKLPLALLDGMDLKNHRYGFIGTEDWTMYPLIQPGSLVLIDDTKRKLVTSGWTNEFERPIYFLEHRNGYLAGWCTLSEDMLIVHAHPASYSDVTIFSYPSEVDIIGQITGVAMRLDQGRRRRGRS
ncbi:MAG: helix-turn-helix transcriptional regulator [Bryobacterales bacterium]|nr:helix-turn-helix transcriptional regulator [Bryobacterales bacterium]